MSYPQYAGYSQEEKRPPIGALIGGGIAFTAILLVLFFTVARRPENVPAPTAYRPYVAADKAFACDAPDGWARQGTAAQAIQSGVVFKQGDAVITIDADLTGSLMGDMMRASSNASGGSGDMSSDPGAQAFLSQLPPQMRAQMAADQREQRKPPVERLHAQGRRSLELRYAHYAEQPMQSLPSRLGEGRYSEWTGEQSGFLTSGKVHGYRVTILNNDRRVTVLCHCPESSWATLKPAFGNVIGSLNNVPGS